MTFTKSWQFFVIIISSGGKNNQFHYQFWRFYIIRKSEVKNLILSLKVTTLLTYHIAPQDSGEMNKIQIFGVFCLVLNRSELFKVPLYPNRTREKDPNSTPQDLALHQTEQYVFTTNRFWNTTIKVEIYHTVTVVDITMWRVSKISSEYH